MLSEKKNAMDKKLDSVRGRKELQRHPARNTAQRSREELLQKKQKEALRCQQLEEIFASLPENIMVCDSKGKILRLNAAASTLFDVPFKHQYQGEDYQEFLAPYLRCQQKQPIPPEFWLKHPERMEETSAQPAETILTLQVPSGRQSMVRVSHAPAYDEQQRIWGIIYIFHELSQRDQQALHLQRVREAILTLTEAIAHLPEQFPLPLTDALSTDSLLLSPPVIFIAQQLACIIRQTLDCPRVSLKAIGPSGYVYFVAGSGFNAEQEQPERAISGRLTLAELLDPPLIERLSTKQEVVIRGNRIHFPPGYDNLAIENILLIPLFRDTHMTGMLCVIKEGLRSTYTPEEIELVKAVAALAVLVVRWLDAAQKQTEAQAREHALQEIHQLSQDFLVLASHELRTPLTSILGNIQLAQRRVAALERQVGAQADALREPLARAQQSLASASRSAQLQQRMIATLIDDARLATDHFQLHFQPCDILAFLKGVVASTEQHALEHPLLLNLPEPPRPLFVLADAERIGRVFTTYLENALAFSPPGRPVTIGVQANKKTMRVQVHNEGPGIPPEEQEHLWERFYRARGNSIQNELDLSLGLRLYLCRAFIERHGGEVGVQSNPHHGTTFWFTLPLMPATSQQQGARARKRTHP